MASVFELATLSEMTYDSKRVTFRDWKRKGKFGPPSGRSFYCEYYFNVKKREVVLAIRGTDAGDGETDMSDIASDIQIGLAHTPSQLKKAKEAYSIVKSLASESFNHGYNFYLTGHSLGGGLASLLSAINGGKPTVTFNAPGVQRTFTGSHLINNLTPTGSLLNTIKNMYHMSSVNTDQMLHLRAVGDVVSLATGRHMGKVEDVYVGTYSGEDEDAEFAGFISQHSISNMVKSLRSKPGQYHKDLGWKSLA